MLRKYVLPLLIWLIYQPLRLSWRVQIVETTQLKEAIANQRPIVFAHWHGDELGILYLLRHYRACAMTSTSKDGELINGFLKLMGVKTSRGSSTRGGVAALKGILRLAKQGYRPSVAVDGPKGPYHKVKPGIFEISKLTSGEIHPLAVACSKAFVFKKSWNKTYIPYPFAKIVVIWGEPLPPVAKAQESQDLGLAQQLERSLSNAGQYARNLIAAPMG